VEQRRRATPNTPATTASGAPATDGRSPDRFPALVALGEHVWVDNRDQRFTGGLQVLADGLEHARNAPHRLAPKRRPTTPRGGQSSQQTTGGDTQWRGIR
jgi:hypothetical protein